MYSMNGCTKGWRADEVSEIERERRLRKEKERERRERGGEGGQRERV